MTARSTTLRVEIWSWPWLLISMTQGTQMVYHCCREEVLTLEVVRVRMRCILSCSWWSADSSCEMSGARAWRCVDPQKSRRETHAARSWQHRCIDGFECTQSENANPREQISRNHAHDNINVMCQFKELNPSLKPLGLYFLNLPL